MSCYNGAVKSNRAATRENRDSGTSKMKKAKHGRHAAPEPSEAPVQTHDETPAPSHAKAAPEPPSLAQAPGKTFVMPKQSKKKSPDDPARAKGKKGEGGKPAQPTSESAVPNGAADPSQATLALPVDPVKHTDLDKKPRSRTPLKVFGIVLGVIVAVAALVYVAGAVVFMGRFFPHTVVGKSDISLKTPEEVQQILEESVSDYRLSVSGLGFSLDLTAEEAGLVLDGQTISHSMMSKMNPWKWPYEVFQDHDETDALLATYNQSGLSEAVHAAVEAFNAEGEAPKNAYVAFDEKKSQFVIVPEEAGTTLSADAVMTLVDEAIVVLHSKVELGPAQLAQPNMLSTDPVLTQAAATANGMILVDVGLTMAGTEVATLDASVVSGWVVIGADQSVTLDTAAMEAWVDEVAATHTTTGTERTYTRPDGKQVTVSGGSYGWVVDRDALLSLVQTAVDTDQTGLVEMPCTYTAGAYSGPGLQDWGSRYVDVDLSEQYARMYDGSGSVIWESPIVSGKPTKSGSGSITPTGVYYITTKASPSVLKGFNDDGSKYESHVTYWMPFIDNAVGLHDANWQSSFGGTRYRDGAGSHGCVNLPVGKAADLYGIIELTDVVVVHW